MAEAIQSQSYLLTVAAGKRLIAKAVAALPQIRAALETHTIAIVAGSTNGYIAEELLRELNQLGDFTKETFFRGITTPPGVKINTQKGGYFGRDVILEKGRWIKEKNIFDCAPELGTGDIILKGANAVNFEKKQAGILIGSPVLGTSAAILQAAVGKRVELILPVGLEKRVCGDIFDLSLKMNAPSASGNRLLPVSGTILTELESIRILTGADAELVAAGGAFGAEGAVWIAVSGSQKQIETASVLMESVRSEPRYGD